MIDPDSVGPDDEPVSARETREDLLGRSRRSRVAVPGSLLRVADGRGSRTADQLQEHFQIERELSDRLRTAVSKEARRALYGVVYRERTERISHHPLVRQAADPMARQKAVDPQVRLLRRFVRRDSVFLEIGAGDGAVARAISPLVKRSVAMDVADALALRDEGNFEFRTFNGFDLGLTPGSIDVAYSNDVVEHLHPDDMLDQARAVRQVIRPGGKYVCVTPNRLTGPHDISGLFVTGTPQGFHLREYTTTELAGQFRRAGFRDVKVVLTYHGRRLSPTLPATTVTPVENLLGLLPRALRAHCAPALAAMKVIAVA